MSTLLLHACCAPCAAPVVEHLLQGGERPLVFFSNSNIDTREEHDKRLAELQRYCAASGVEVIADEYEVYCSEKHVANGIVKADTLYIRNLYQELSREHRL